MANSTRTYDLPVKPSWFQGGTKHHIYIKAPLARALGARPGDGSVRVAVYVDGTQCANGRLRGATWFLTEVDAVFDALGISASDAGKRVVCAQGRRSPDGQRIDLHLWIPRAVPPVAPIVMESGTDTIDDVATSETEADLNLDDDYSDETAPEGSVRQILVNAYERSPELRRACIEHWGMKCVACGFSFDAAYGALGSGFIHVHHLTPLAEVGGEHEVDPIRDLQPVCANCHAVIHRRRPAVALADVIAAVQAARDAQDAQQGNGSDAASRRG